MGFFQSVFRKFKANNSNNSKMDERPEEFGLEEYSSELSTDLNEDSYTPNGVELKDSSNSLKLVYNGILAKSGAQEIYSVVGYGSNSNWEDVQYYPMYKAGEQSFEQFIPVRNSGNINIAFKDGVGNWDNNSGTNYIFYNSL